MRFPTYLIRTPAGFAFQIHIPQPLRDHFGGRARIRCALGPDRADAQRTALKLASIYDRAFRMMEGSGVPDDDILKTAQAAVNRRRRKDWKIQNGPHGPEFSTEPHDTPETLAVGERAHTRALDAWERVEAARAADEAKFSSPAYLAAVAAIQGPPRATQAAPGSGITLAAAFAAWSALESKAMALAGKPVKSWRVKERAVREWMEEQGDQTPLASRTAADLSTYAATLAAKYNGSTPNSRLGYIAQFFDWAQRAGHYPDDRKNPARPDGKAWVKYGKKEREAAAKRGAQAFEDSDLKRIFAAATFGQLPARERWQALLLAYTGSRGDEIARLRLGDVHNDEAAGGWWIAIRGGKTDATARRIPLHDDLVKLGFPRWVDARRADGTTDLFPGLPQDSANGPAQTLGKVFGDYLRGLGVEPPKGTRGTTHRFRDTVITTLDAAGVEQSWQERFTGHAVAGRSVLAVPHVENYTNTERRGAWLAQVAAIRTRCCPPISWIKHGVIDLTEVAALMLDVSLPAPKKSGRKPKPKNPKTPEQIEHARRAAERKARRDAFKAGLAEEKK